MGMLRMETNFDFRIIWWNGTKISTSRDWTRQSYFWTWRCCCIWLLPKFPSFYVHFSLGTGMIALSIRFRAMVTPFIRFWNMVPEFKGLGVRFRGKGGMGLALIMESDATTLPWTCIFGMRLPHEVKRNPFLFSERTFLTVLHITHFNKDEKL